MDASNVGVHANDLNNNEQSEEGRKQFLRLHVCTLCNNSYYQVIESFVDL